MEETSTRPFNPEAVRACQHRFQEELEERVGTKDLRMETREILSYLNAHLFQNGLSVGRACRDCGIADHNFTSTFKAEVGVGMREYITQTRIEMAQILLRTFSIPVMEVGWLVGYDYPETFSRVFRRIVGSSATEYRRAHRTSQA